MTVVLSHNRIELNQRNLAMAMFMRVNPKCRLCLPETPYCCAD